MNAFLAKFKQIDSRMRTIGLGCLLLVVFVADFFFLIRPQFSHYIKIGKDIKELRANIDSTTQSIGRIGVLRSAVEKEKKTIIALQDRLTPRDSVAIILERVSFVASKNHINIERIAPYINEGKILLEKGEKKYVTLPVVLEIETGYHNFGRFVNALENDVLFMRVEKFSIVGSSSGLLKIDVTLQAMMFDGEKMSADLAESQSLEASKSGQIMNEASAL